MVVYGIQHVQIQAATNFADVVESWSTEVVVQWLSGLPDAVETWILAAFERSNINGARLLLLDSDDLDQCFGVSNQSARDTLLSSIRLLADFCYNLESENLLSLALAIGVRTRNVQNELSCFLRSRSGVQTVGVAGSQRFALPEALLRSATTTLADDVERFLGWLERPPFDQPQRFKDVRDAVSRLTKAVLSTAEAREEVTSERQLTAFAELLREQCRQLSNFCQKLIEECRDSSMLQTAFLDRVVLHRENLKDEFGFLQEAKQNGVNVVKFVKFGSPAFKSQKIDVGDEIVQINGQIVVGWQLNKLNDQLRLCHSADILLKKRPRDSLQLRSRIQMPRFQLNLAPPSALLSAAPVASNAASNSSSASTPSTPTRPLLAPTPASRTEASRLMLSQRPPLAKSSVASPSYLRRKTRRRSTSVVLDALKESEFAASNAPLTQSSAGAVLPSVCDRTSICAGEHVVLRHRRATVSGVEACQERLSGRAAANLEVHDWDDADNKSRKLDSPLTTDAAAGAGCVATTSPAEDSLSIVDDVFDSPRASLKETCRAIDSEEFATVEVLDNVGFLPDVSGDEWNDPRPCSMNGQLTFCVPTSCSSDVCPAVNSGALQSLVASDRPLRPPASPRCSADALLRSPAKLLKYLLPSSEQLAVTPCELSLADAETIVATKPASSKLELASDDSNEQEDEDDICRLSRDLPLRVRNAEQSAAAARPESEARLVAHCDGSDVAETNNDLRCLSLMPCGSLGNADCSGWTFRLRRSASHSGSMLTLRSMKWSKRWLVLKRADLYIYKSPDDVKAEGIIRLAGFTVCPTGSDYKTRRKNVFKLQRSSASVVFYFSCEHQNDMMMWLNKLGLAAIGYFGNCDSGDGVIASPTRRSQSAECCYFPDEEPTIDLFGSKASLSRWYDQEEQSETNAIAAPSSTRQKFASMSVRPSKASRPQRTGHSANAVSLCLPAEAVCDDRPAERNIASQASPLCGHSASLRSLFRKSARGASSAKDSS